MSEPNWSNEQETRLSHERFVAEVLKTRNAGKGDAKSGWQMFLESTGGAALITVVIGGLAGTWITAQIQKGADERQIKAGMIAAANDAQLEQHKTHLAGQIAATKGAFDLVGATVSANQALLDSYDSDVAIPENIGQLERIRVEFNQAQDAWREQRHSMGFLISYYHGADQKTIGWTGLEARLSTYLRCGAEFQPPAAGMPAEIGAAIDGACIAEKEAMDAAVIEFMERLRNSTDFWIRFKSYKDLKALLGHGVQNR